MRSVQNFLQNQWNEANFEFFTNENKTFKKNVSYWQTVGGQRGLPAIKSLCTLVWSNMRSIEI